VKGRQLLASASGRECWEDWQFGANTHFGDSELSVGSCYVGTACVLGSSSAVQQVARVQLQSTLLVKLLFSVLQLLVCAVVVCAERGTRHRRAALW
jgi:hypothetical protein